MPATGCAFMKELKEITEMGCVGRPNRTPYSFWVDAYPVIDLDVEQEETADPSFLSIQLLILFLR